ncbi:MAG: laminin G [Ponticaulis sp.]|nr:laminin G [Ponticaulis sp.]
MTRRHLTLSALALSGCASAGVKLDQPVPEELWHFNALNQLGGHPASIDSHPELVRSSQSDISYTVFDGEDDALFVDHHPLAGAAAFTFEAVFRPDGGQFEQRWFHLEAFETPAVEPGKGSTRMLFEIRVEGSDWYLDAFMCGEGYAEVLMEPEKRFPVGQWYHVAQTFDGQTYKSFVNGRLQAKSSPTFVPQGTGRSSVGCRMDRRSYFNGAVHSARFVHAALPPEQFRLVTP